MRLSPQELLDGAVNFIGALDFDQRPHGISPYRLPGWARPQVPQQMNVMARMPAGVRMAFSTDSDTIRVRALTTTMVTPPRPQRPVTFDLVADGRLATQVTEASNVITLDPDDPDAWDIRRGEPVEVLFTDLGRHSRHCELWLPHNAFIEIRSMEVEQGASLTPIATPQSNRWVHYGSSISHCMEAEQPTGTWPAVAARRGGMTLFGLGFGGQCHLDQFVARTIRDLAVDFISIKTGINVVNMDSMRERVFVPALHGFLDTIREKHETTPILLISPIYCPSAETRPGPTVANAAGKFVTLDGHDEIREGCLTLIRIRDIIDDVVRTRVSSGDRHIACLPGPELFGEADAADLPDDLHPNPAGYRRMGERFADRVFGEGGILPAIS